MNRGRKGQEQVTKAFKRCGMYNAHDGSEDSEIHVQGIENYDIGRSDDAESESDSSDEESASGSSIGDETNSSSDSESNMEEDSDVDDVGTESTDSASDESAGAPKKRKGQSVSRINQPNLRRNELPRGSTRKDKSDCKEVFVRASQVYLRFSAKNPHEPKQVSSPYR